MVCQGVTTGTARLFHLVHRNLQLLQRIRNIDSRRLPVPGTRSVLLFLCVVITPVPAAIAHHVGEGSGRSVDSRVPPYTWKQLFAAFSGWSLGIPVPFCEHYRYYMKYQYRSVWMGSVNAGAINQLKSGFSLLHLMDRFYAYKS